MAFAVALVTTGIAAAALPTVTAILPPNGNTAGGTVVTIVGSGFSGATAVTMGGVAATAITVINDSMIDATTGVHAAGAVSVTVTTPGGSGTGAGLYTYGTPPVAAGAAWTNQTTGTSASDHNWSSITSSADGRKLAAVEYSASGGNNGIIWTSTDSGATWTDRTTGTSAANRNWVSITSSADGSKLAAGDSGAGPGGDIWTSTDSGATWTDRTTGTSASNLIWVSITSSADGSKLAAVDSFDTIAGGDIWTSTDSGATWTDRTTGTSASNLIWRSITSSADGSKLAAAEDQRGPGGNIWTSTDSGTTWTDRTTGTSAANLNWDSITSSADGSKLAAVDSGGGFGGIWTSTNSGANWTHRSNAGILNWWAITSSADGSKLAAAASPGDIWTSTDSGATWADRTTGTSASNLYWWSLTSSADGSKIAAGDSGGGAGGDIWTSGPPGPSITVQPKPSTVYETHPATFSVTAAGTGTLAYQWQKNSANIPGIAATGSSYNIGAAAFSDAGSYDVLVTDANGTTQSNAATLTVISRSPAVNITPISITVNFGSNVKFTATVVSGIAPFVYQWRKNGVKITGATASTYALSNVQKAAEGSYDVIVTNAYGTTTAAAATLHGIDPVVIGYPPISQAANVGDPVTLSVTATGTGPLSYQWRLNTTPLNGETNATLSFTADATKGGNYDVVVTNVVGSVTSKPAALTILAPPVITSPPIDQLVNAGSQVLFSVTATGDGLTYQWRRNGVALAGKTASVLSISSALAANVGNYDVVVKNSSYGTVISSPAALQLIALLNITSQPADVTANLGDTAAFSVTASGPGVLGYQWYKNGLAMTYANSATLTFPVTDASVAGIYIATVTTGALKVTSTSASLRVNDRGLLIYNVTATGTTAQGTTSTPVAVTGTLVVDRANERGGFIWFGKSGIVNTFRTEINESLRAHSTGPVASSVTVISRVGQTGVAPSEDLDFLWLKGRDSLLTISATDKTMGPLTLAGTLDSLILEGGMQAEGLSLTGVLDAASSSQARQSGETVERSINRLAAGWQLKGYVWQ